MKGLAPDMYCTDVCVEANLLKQSRSHITLVPFDLSLACASK